MTKNVDFVQFFLSQFPDIICQKAWSFVIEKFPKTFLSSTTFWECRDKILSWNIETGTEITISCEDAQTEFINIVLLSVSLRMTYAKLLKLIYESYLRNYLLLLSWVLIDTIVL